MLITGPWVGSFRALMLLPSASSGSGPHPAVLAVHGHGGEGLDFILAMGGQDFARSGYVFLAIDVRANWGDEVEVDIGYSLFREGFSLQGLHLYEILLTWRYLA